MDCGRQSNQSLVRTVSTIFSLSTENVLGRHISFVDERSVQKTFPSLLSDVSRIFTCISYRTYSVVSGH